MEFGNVKATYEFALRREESGTRELNSLTSTPACPDCTVKIF